MVVLAPGQEIGASDIPSDIRDEGTRLLPATVHAVPTAELEGKQLEFIFHSLVELKLQIEELRRRIDEPTTRGMEAIEIHERGVFPDLLQVDAIDLTEPVEEPAPPVLYREGMTMADVERSAIEAALRENHGNRRKASEQLGIGERTLYRKIKEYGLA